MRISDWSSDVCSSDLHGLHAAPLTRLRPGLAPGRRAILLLRDGPAVGQLAAWLTEQGFGGSILHVLEALGGPRERIRPCTAEAPDLADIERKSVVEGKSVSVRFDFGGRRNIQKKNKQR